MITDQDQYGREIYIFNDEKISEYIGLLQDAKFDHSLLDRRTTNLCLHAPNNVDALWECAKIVGELKYTATQEGFLRCMLEMDSHGHARVRDGCNETVTRLCQQAEKFVVLLFFKIN